VAVMLSPEYEASLSLVTLARAAEYTALAEAMLGYPSHRS
jgi:hypothetical protein